MTEERTEERTDKARDLHRMKSAATGLLVAMIALFAVTQFYESAYPVLGFARAFAEAGIAGGIADWFAVTALFRHPLGLPLPHTAIIPLNKDRIGDDLGSFFERNFLSQEVIGAKLSEVDLAGTFLRWIGRPEQVEQIAEYLTALAPELLKKIDSEDIVQFAHGAIAARIREIDIAPMATDVLARLVRNIEFDALITPALEELARLFHENKDVIRQRVRGETGWIWQRLSMDEKVAETTVRVIDEAIREVRDTPDHPWRRHFHQFGETLVMGIATSPAYVERLQDLRDKLVDHPAVLASLRGLWQELTHAVHADSRSSHSVVKARLQEVMIQWTQDGLNDESLRARLNQRARAVIVQIVPAQRHELAGMIADTVRRWDTETVTRKLEVEVGRDLQFVRINGTLIGGLVGLVLYALGMLA